jgi:hypothetical protein
LQVTLTTNDKTCNEILQHIRKLASDTNSIHWQVTYLRPGTEKTKQGLHEQDNYLGSVIGWAESKHESVKKGSSVTTELPK